MIRQVTVEKEAELGHYLPDFLLLGIFLGILQIDSTHFQV